jgi:hypothetical protein
LALRRARSLSPAKMRRFAMTMPPNHRKVYSKEKPESRLGVASQFCKL